jgi:D-alanyl-D-alanine carboxypeptidase (penicillin-binding protein 5/6)
MRVTRTRIIAYVSTAAWLLCSVSAAAGSGPTPPAVDGKSAILVDAVSGKVLCEKACRVRRPPASTTKIMTAILAIEHCKPGEVFQASARACETPHGNLHLKPGEQLDLDNMMRGMMLRSANDGAQCVAEHIAGSASEFARMMNAKAQELGAKNTHFVNPHGLYDPKHYSTAYDLAMIARYAIKLPRFNEVVRTKTARIERSINKKDVFVRNTARFLWRYEGADGIKTGYTREAGRCFVGSATRDGWRLIAVVLKSKDAGKDAAALLDYGFKYFKPVCYAKTTEPAKTLLVVGGVYRTIDLMPSRDLALVLRKSDNAEARTETDTRRAVAPIEKGEKLGTLTGYLNGEKVGVVDLVAAESVDRTLIATIWYFARSALGIAVLLFAGILTYGTQTAKAARRRRRGLS